MNYLNVPEWNWYVLLFSQSNVPPPQVGKLPEVNGDEFSKKFEGRDICNEWCSIREAYGDLLDQVFKSRHRTLTMKNNVKIKSIITD